MEGHQTKADKSAAGTSDLRLVFESAENQDNPVDVIAVHGLGAHPYWTWIHKGTEKNVNWLTEPEMLPSIVQHGRIFTFSYGSTWLHNAPQQRLRLCAETLLDCWKRNKASVDGTGRERPVLFIGHSFGGLVIMQALAIASTGGFHALCSATIGVIFLGTPLRGSKAARWAIVVAQTSKALGYDGEVDILQELTLHSNAMRDLRYDFVRQAKKYSWEISCFWEQISTKYKYKGLSLPVKIKIVDEDSACFDGADRHSLAVDHIGLNKFSGLSDPSYKTVAAVITSMLSRSIAKELATLPSKNAQDLSVSPTELFPDLPAKPVAFCGRDAEFRQLRALLTDEEPACLCIRGPGGIGKTALAQEAMHDRAVEAVYHAIVYVSLSGNKSFQDFVSTVATALNVTGDNITTQILRRLRSLSGRVLLCLDDMEHPWDTADRTMVEQFLAQLVLPNTTLMVLIRGNELPAYTKWSHILQPLEPLRLEAAKEAFEIVSGRHSSPFSTLINDMGSIPLAITLLAGLVQSGEGPDDLMRRWQLEKTGLLQRSSYPTPDSSIPASIQLSLSSPRFQGQPNAGQLLALLSMYPSGLAVDYIVNLYHKESIQIYPSITVLCQLALANRREMEPTVATRETYLLVLPIISIYMQNQKDILPHPNILSRVQSLHITFAKCGAFVWYGRGGRSDLAKIMAFRSPNIEVTLLHVLQKDVSQEVLQAVLGYGSFTLFTGIGSTKPLEQAVLLREPEYVDVLPSDASSIGERAKLISKCQQMLANIYLLRNSLDKAKQAFHAAIALAIKVEDLVQQGQCRSGLADAHRQSGELDEAEQGYNQALDLFIDAQAFCDQGNCLLKLGKLYAKRSELEKANAFLARAFKLLQGPEDTFGRADCLQVAGDVALRQLQVDVHDKLQTARQVAWRQSQLDIAQEAFNSALQLHQQRGNVQGEGSCLESLGRVELIRGNLQSAKQCSEEALALLNETGDSLGQGNCLSNLARIFWRQSQLSLVEQHFQDAAALFEAISAYESLGGCLAALGELQMEQQNWSGALQSFTAALTAYKTGNKSNFLRQQGYCLRQLGRVHIEHNDLQAAQQSFQSAVEVSRLGCVPINEGLALMELAEMQITAFNLGDGCELVQEALDLFVHNNFDLGQATCYKRLGEIALRQGQNLVAMEQFEQAYYIYYDLDSVDGLAMCLNGQGTAHLHLSQYDEAVNYLNQALTLYESLGDHVGQGNCKKDLAIIEFRGFPAGQADLGHAASVLREALQHFYTIVPPQKNGIATCKFYLGRMEWPGKDVEEAMRNTVEAAQLFEELGNVTTHTCCVLDMGKHYLKMGRYPEARIKANVALGIFERRGDSWNARQARALLSRIP